MRTNGNEHVNPDLPVLHSVENVFLRELVRKARSVFQEALFDLSLLFFTQKACTTEKSL